MQIIFYRRWVGLKLKEKEIVLAKRNAVDANKTT